MDGRWRRMGTVLVLLAVLLVSGGQQPVHAQGAPGEFVGIPPARLLDTRIGFQTIDGVSAGGGAIAQGVSIDVQVTGRGGVPTTRVAAVVLNVTSVGSTSPTHVTVYPAGSPRPNASNLNVPAGRTIPNLVVVRIGSAGRVSFYNNAGSTHLLADVAGFMLEGSGFVAVAPSRVMDSRLGFDTVDGQRAGFGPVGPGQSVDLQVGGRGGLPVAGVTAVVLNVTATDSSANTFVTVHPASQGRPGTSNLNVVPGQTVPNLVTSGVSSDGRVTIYNNAGTVHLIVDVLGAYTVGSSPAGSVPIYQPLAVPARIADTRAAADGGASFDGFDVGHDPVGSFADRFWIGRPASLRILGRGGVPGTGVAALQLNVTVTVTSSTPRDLAAPCSSVGGRTTCGIVAGPPVEAFLAVWPNGLTQPNASNLNFSVGDTVTNSVIVPVGPRGSGIGINGDVLFRQSVPGADLIVDVVGWFPET